MVFLLDFNKYLMVNFLFKIENLVCAYNEDIPVMKVNQLVIPKGKLIFILGVSGIGKSTFIETLGLMNKTIVKKKDTSIKFSFEERTIEVKDHWNLPNNALSKFRNDHFSFIFQNTNLMPNFTAGENMCISQLIKGDSIEKVKSTVLKIMDQLDLPQELFDRKITELSGGQRQRIAFIRAIIADFKVLFGDEPTGNLDQDTATKLMNMLKDNLEINNRTGIIVSHDIDLALQFADQIILLTPNKEGFGEIKANNILIFEDPQNVKSLANKSILKPKEFIYNQLNVEVKPTVHA